MTDDSNQAEDAKRLGTDQSLDQPSDAQVNSEITRLNAMVDQNAKAMQRAMTNINAIAEHVSKEAQKPSARHQAEYQNISLAEGSTTDSRPVRLVKDWYKIPEERPHDRYENEDESANALFGHKKEYVERLKKRENDGDGPYDT